MQAAGSGRASDRGSRALAKPRALAVPWRCARRPQDYRQAGRRGDGRGACCCRRLAWGGQWRHGASARPWLGARLAGSTLLSYRLILAEIRIASRLARPLKELAAAADRFEGRGEAPEVEPRGPADVRHAILAFNAMGARVSAMLDEKDRMLGAIGHDMRTPLASLRIRAESMEPEAERESDIHVVTRAVYRSNNEGYLDPKRPQHLWVVSAPRNADEKVKSKK